MKETTSLQFKCTYRISITTDQFSQNLLSISENSHTYTSSLINFSASSNTSIKEKLSQYLEQWLPKQVEKIHMILMRNYAKKFNLASIFID